jgi:hypothetical protein
VDLSRTLQVFNDRPAVRETRRQSFGAKAWRFMTWLFDPTSIKRETIVETPVERLLESGIYRDA